MGRLVQSTSEVQRILDEADGIREFVTETVGNESQILRGEIQSLSEGVTERILEQDEKINAATSALDATIEEQNDFLVEMQKELGEKMEEDVAELSGQIETSIAESNQQITTRFNEQDALINAEFEKQNKEVAKVTTFDTKLAELSDETDARFNESAESTREQIRTLEDKADNKFASVDSEIENLKRGEAYVIGETLAFRNYADAKIIGNTLKL